MIDYKKISRNIRIVYAALMLAVVTLVVLCECHVMPIEGMLLDVAPGSMYILEVGMLFAVGIGIFAALKGFNWCLLHKVRVAEGARKAELYQLPTRSVDDLGRYLLLWYIRKLGYVLHPCRSCVLILLLALGRRCRDRTNS